MLGVLNELWLVCCILTIFYDPIISDTVQQNIGLETLLLFVYIEYKVKTCDDR